jgi:glycine betaine/proline transport system substrate-binding protein
LDELWEPEIVSDATFKAQLKAAYTNEKPILFYYWTPEWLFAAYDLSPLDEPPVTEGCRVLNLEQEDWLEASTFKCKHNDAEVWIGHSKSLEQRNPAVAKMLSNMVLDPNTVNDWILRIGRDEENAQDVAEQWVEENMDTVNAWING